MKNNSAALSQLSLKYLSLFLSKIQLTITNKHIKKILEFKTNVPKTNENGINITDTNKKLIFLCIEIKFIF